MRKTIFLLGPSCLGSGCSIPEDFQKKVQTEKEKYDGFQILKSTKSKSANV